MIRKAVIAIVLTIKICSGAALVWVLGRALFGDLVAPTVACDPLSPEHQGHEKGHVH